MATGAAPPHSAGDHENHDNHYNPLAPPIAPKNLDFCDKVIFTVLQQHEVFTLHRSQDFDLVATSKIQAFVSSC